MLIHGALGRNRTWWRCISPLLGATVIATRRSASKLAAVKAQGRSRGELQTRTVTPESAPSREDIKGADRRPGVDVVYDGVGGEIRRACAAWFGAGSSSSAGRPPRTWPAVRG